MDIALQNTVAFALENVFLVLSLANFTGNHVIHTLAGIVGIVCGLSAIYNAMGQIVNAEYGKVVLPL